jgi:hypothetical protein
LLRCAVVSVARCKLLSPAAAAAASGGKTSGDDGTGSDDGGDNDCVGLPKDQTAAAKMVAESALSEVAACRQRGLGHYFKICTPMFARATLRIAGALGRRAVSRGKHPLGWSLHQELLVTLMREVLATRDLGVWRALFSIGAVLVARGWGGAWVVGCEGRVFVTDLAGVGASPPSLRLKRKADPQTNK